MHPLVKVFMWLMIATVGSAGLLFAAAMVFMSIVWWSSEGTGSDGGAGSALLRELFHDGPRYFEVTIDLEVEGSPVEITRVMVCEPYFLHRWGVGHFLKRWYMTRDAITHRLPDGSGVIIVIPTPCDDFVHPQPADAPPWGAVPDFPEGFVPLILWTANADDPEFLECYYTFESLDRPSSRVRFMSISLRNSADLEPRTSPEEFGVWNHVQYPGTAARNARKRAASRLHYLDMNYIGYYVLALNEDSWRSVPELDAALSRAAESHFLPNGLVNALHRRFRLNTDRFDFAIRAIAKARIRPETSKAGDPVEDPRIGVYPTQLVDGSLVTQTDREGIILYRRESSARPAESSRLFFGAADITWPRNHPYVTFFDTDNGTLLELRWSSLSFHPMHAE